MTRRILFFLALALLLSGCNGKGRLLNLTKASPAPVVVKVQRAGALSESVSTGYVGTVSPSRTAVVSASASGTLTRLTVKEGSRVAKGQKLAVIASQAVSSAYDAASSRLAQAEDGWQRIQPVYQSGTVTEVDYLRIKTQLDEARAAEAAARSARDRCTLKAPFSGVVEKLYLTEGVETTLAEPVVKIVSLDQPEIRFPLPENEFARHRVGETVRVEIPALSYTGTAKLLTKGVSASSLSHSYECSVSTPHGADGLMPGMICKVFLQEETAEGIVIPAASVLTDMEGRFVWTATGGVVAKKHIRIGGYSGQGILVAEGLEEDDLVIIEGSRKVSVGMEVKTQQ